MDNTPSAEENPLFHDTWKLLKNYRDAVWNLELAVQQVKNQFEIEYGSSIEEFLDSIYLAGADIGGSRLENYAQSIERSNKMLKPSMSQRNCCQVIGFNSVSLRGHLKEPFSSLL